MDCRGATEALGSEELVWRVGEEELRAWGLPGPKSHSPPAQHALCFCLLTVHHPALTREATSLGITVIIFPSFSRSGSLTSDPAASYILPCLYLAACPQAVGPLLSYSR